MAPKGQKQINILPSFSIILYRQKPIDKGDKDMNDPKERIVFSKKLAIILREAGFKILRVEVNKKYPQYDVYIF